MLTWSPSMPGSLPSMRRSERWSAAALPWGITGVRTVQIVGLDLQADGGTHVANTREVGGITVIGTRSKGRINKRLEIAPVDAAVD